MTTTIATDRDAPNNGRVIQSGRHNPGDLIRQMGTEIYHVAAKRGMSLSAMLEIENPTTPEEAKQGLDCFSRMLKHEGIRTQGFPEWGVESDKFEAFDKNDQTRAMVPEWVARVWRRTQNGGNPYQRPVYMSDDFGVGTLLQAWNDQPGIRAKQLAPAIPLSALIAQTTQIDSDAYRAFYLTDSTADERMVRVAENAEVPQAYLTGGDHTIRLQKYGRAFAASYEVLRRTPIDRVAFHLARLAIQTEIDKVATAIDILVNGDGNANTAATSYNLTTLDSGTTANNPTLKAYIAYKMKFANPYLLTTALAQEAGALQLLLLNAGSANIPMVFIQNQLGIGNFTAINPGLGDGVRLGWTADAPASQIVGFDARFALERITEIGSNLQEVDRWVTRQSQVLVMTEVEGYAILDQNATKILNLAA